MGKCREIRSGASSVKVLSMRGDGNCLFRSLSYLLSGVQSNHKVVREEVLRFINANKHISQQIQSEHFHQHVTKMQQEGTWDTELEIFAFASITTRMVYVYCVDGKVDGYHINPY